VCHLKQIPFDFNVFSLFMGKTSPFCYIIPSLATIIYTLHAIISDRDGLFSEMRSYKLVLHCEGINSRER